MTNRLKLKKIKQAYDQRRLVPFIGAGLAMPFNIPGWAELIRNLSQLYLDEKYLEIINNYIEKQDYWGAIELIKSHGDVNDMDIQLQIVEFIQPKINIDIDNKLHNYGDLSNMKFSNIFTTNYDFFITKYINNPIVVPQIPHKVEMNSQTFFDQNSITKVWHLHGHISDPGSIVISKEKYEQLYSNGKYRKIFELFQANSVFLFIGFSMNDFYIQNILEENKAYFNSQHYIVLDRPSTDFKAKLKREYNINVIEYDSSKSSHVECIRNILNDIASDINSEDHTNINEGKAKKDDTSIKPIESINKIGIITQNENIKKRFSIISLFSGCGGLDLGFKGSFEYLGNKYEDNGFDIIWANDISENSVDTYKSYFGENIIHKDINEIDTKELPDADIVIGSLPCIRFSKVEEYPENIIYSKVKKIINYIKPKVFILESGRDLLTIDKGQTIDYMIKDFKDIGYNIQYHLIKAQNYGVPQRIERLIIYGMNKEFNKESIIPIETHKEIEWINTKDAIDDLWYKFNKNIPNHTIKYCSQAKFNKNLYSKYSWNRRRNIRIEANKISPTIMYTYIYGHYRANGDESDSNNWRRLSVREYARIHTFPDDFVFYCSARDAYKQITNSTPPVLAWNIGKSVYKFLIDKNLYTD
ncbi:DNA (cytosine-5-)-methyltransferase [Paraclostridium bifermentans]|uniref:DNA (cytosine-5-)-methyltransferase n=1 Tax=Paraclostridium bifermentans TaxID=1490 RepID=UPI0034DFC2E0